MGKGVKVAPAVEKGGVALVVWIVALVVGGVVLVVGGVARVVGVVGRVPQGACARYAGEVRLR